MRGYQSPMIRSFARLTLFFALAAPAAFGGEGITVTVGVTPSCPYGLAG